MNGPLVRLQAWARALRPPPVPPWLGRIYLWRLFVRAGRDFIVDDCTTWASVIAYATLLSLFPILLVVLTVLGYVISDETSRTNFIIGVAGIFPGAGTLIQQTVATVVANHTSTTWFAFVTLLGSGSGVFQAVNRYLNAIWRTTTNRSLIESTLLAGFMVVAVALLYLVSLLLSAMLYFASLVAESFMAVAPDVAASLNPVSTLGLTVFLTIVLFTLMYRFIPNVTVRWSYAASGGVVAGLLFEVAKQVFGFYLIAFANLNAVYGSIGAVIALLLWAFVSANILLFGGEISHAASVVSAAPPPSDPAGPAR